MEQRINSSQLQAKATGYMFSMLTSSFPSFPYDYDDD